MSEVKLPKNALLGAVLREDEVFIPDGNSQIKEGDKVVMFAFPSAIQDIEKVFN